MVESAGLLIIQDNKILLAHPTKAPWYGSYTIPKGKVERGETYIEAAIRETKEEIGIDIDDSEIGKEVNVIYYSNEDGKVYKRVYYFLVYPKNKITIDKTKLARKEVNWAGFVDKSDALGRIFWRFEEMLEYIK